LFFFLGIENQISKIDRIFDTNSLRAPSNSATGVFTSKSLKMYCYFEYEVLKALLFLKVQKYVPKFTSLIKT